MLMLQRKVGESVLIDGGIRVTVSRIDRGKVVLGFEGPKSVTFLRAEVADHRQHDVFANGRDCVDDVLTKEEQAKL